MDTKQPEAIRREYRATMPTEVLHLWAQDALACIAELEASLTTQAQPVGAAPVAWQCRHMTESTFWQDCGEEIAKVRAKRTEKWEVRALYAAPKPAAQALDAKEKRWLEIGKAVERACEELPEDAEITVSLERDAGTDTMSDWDGNEHDNFPHEDGLGGVMNAAIDAAIAAQQGAKP